MTGGPGANKVVIAVGLVGLVACGPPDVAPPVDPQPLPEGVADSDAINGATADADQRTSMRTDGAPATVVRPERPPASEGRGRGLVWGFDQKLAASDARPGGAFASSVALDRDTALVGAIGNPSFDLPGSLYVFRRAAGWWTERQKLQAPEPAGLDGFGVAVALEGATALVGACSDPLYQLAAPQQPGAVHVLELVADQWTAAGTLEPGEPIALDDAFGCALALDGNIAVVGAPRDDDQATDAGAVYVFSRSGAIWQAGQKLTVAGSNPAAEFGVALAVRDGTLIVGASGAITEGVSTGAAYTYELQGGVFANEQRLSPSDGASSDRFGGAVSVDGDTAVVGAKYKTYEQGDEAYPHQGAAYVFWRAPDAWSEQQRLGPEEPAAEYQFGKSVAVRGDTLMVGATDSNFGTTPGNVYVYLPSADGWALDRIANDGGLQAGAALGFNIALDAERALVGAWLSHEQGASYSGAALVLSRTRYANGDPCSSPELCDSRFCVDGVCCNSECGGGETGDCRACSVSAGAPADGYCADAVDDTACEDGLYCTADDRCAGGACVGGPSHCPGPNANDDCAESCDEPTRSCTAYDGDNASCLDGVCLDGTCLRDDGAACTLGVECATGSCVDGLCCAEPSCAPYRCIAGGTCASRCESAADCAPGSRCSSAGRCLPPEAEHGRDPGCFCGIPRRRSSRPTAAAAVALLFATLGRRRAPPSRRREAGTRPSHPPAVRLARARRAGGALLGLGLAACGADDSSVGQPFGAGGDETTLWPAVGEPSMAARSQRVAGPPPFTLSADGARVRALLPALDASVELTRDTMAIVSQAKAAPGGAATAAWTLGLRATAIGRGSQREPLAPSASGPDLAATRVSFHRGPTVREWYVNHRRGLEQGFELLAPPARAAGHQPLFVEQALSGAIVANADRQELELHVVNGPMLRYGELRATDADGRVLPTHMDAVGTRLRLFVDDRFARYPVEIDPLIWAVRQPLVVESTEQGAAFALSAAMQDTTIVLGAPKSVFVPAPGQAHVFERGADSRWNLQQTLAPSDTALNDYFGYSLALAGPRLLVGATWDHDLPFIEDAPRGAAYLFERDESGWVERQKLAVEGVEESDGFGLAVAIDGPIAVVGAPWTERTTAGGALGGAGCVHVFREAGTSFAYRGPLWPGDGDLDGRAGAALALSGDTLLVGARGESPDGLASAGAGYVLRLDGDEWIEEQRLLAPDRAADDRFGYAVALAGDTAIVGAPGHDEWAEDAGAAYVFKRSSVSGVPVWELQAELHGLDASPEDSFGFALSLVGDTLAVGAPMAASALASFSPPPGKAYLLTDSGAGWAESARLQISPVAPGGPLPGGMLGTSVSVQPGWLVAGAPVADSSDGETTVPMTGAAYLFGLAHADGDPCTSGDECASRFCVDGVCCDAECGRADVRACQVCSVATGAVADGVCTSLDDGTSCDDGLFCNGPDGCRAGACTEHAGYPCTGRNDGDGDCSESCDELGDHCRAPDDDNVACDDGRCRQGVCAQNPGGVCESDAECRYGNCLDGVCCWVEDCGAYRCGPGGTCFQSCRSRNDCAPGAECMSTGQCSPVVPSSDGAGCACRTSGRGGTAYAGWLASVSVAASLRRRLRRAR